MTNGDVAGLGKALVQGAMPGAPVEEGGGTAQASNYGGYTDEFANALHKEMESSLEFGAPAVGATLFVLSMALPGGGEEELGLSILKNVQLVGGRSGQLVKKLIGPINSVVRGGGKRAFVTNGKGQVILDITKDRVKAVTPDKGFGPKRPPTQDELDLLEKLFK
jgi:hypothetical protein